MTALTMADIVEKDKIALLGLVSDLKRELLNLRFQKASGEMTNTSRFREVRVGIARAYTQLSVLTNQSSRG
jgi:large subunit ribosomal protein L29